MYQPIFQSSKLQRNFEKKHIIIEYFNFESLPDNENMRNMKIIDNNYNFTRPDLLKNTDKLLSNMDIINNRHLS